MKRQRDRDQAASETLRLLCNEVCAVTGKDVGGRVWVLPTWYVMSYHRDRRFLMGFAELGSKALGRPRMALAATQYGPVVVRSKVKWVVGKGLPGYLTFEEELFAVIHHDEDWPDVRAMTERQWANLDDAMTRGRSLRDAQQLNALYGTVVGVPLMDPRSKARLGCVTLHTKHGERLTDDEATEAAILMTSRTTELGTKLAHTFNLVDRL